MSAACALCGDTSLVPRYRGLRDLAERSTVEYAFLACQRCGSLTLQPMPSPVELAVLYPEHYTFRDQEAPAGRSGLAWQLAWWGYDRWTYTGDVSSVCRLTQRRSGRLLDVGCGSGVHLRLLQQAGFTVEGLEMSAEDCAAARRLLGCTIYQGNIDGVTLPAASFDVITLFNTLEHLPDPVAALRTIHRWLAPGGWLVVKVPVADGWQPRLFGRWWRNVREAPRHLCLPSSRGLRQLFEVAGFTDICHGAASLMENACMVGTSIYPWAIPYCNARHRSLLLRWCNLGVGALLTYASLPEALLETLCRRPSTIVMAGRRPLA